MERNSCLEFKSLIQNIPFMDRELTMVCAQKLAETFNLILLDKENIDSSVSSLKVTETKLLLFNLFLAWRKEISEVIF